MVKWRSPQIKKQRVKIPGTDIWYRCPWCGRAVFDYVTGRYCTRGDRLGRPQDRG